MPQITKYNARVKSNCTRGRTCTCVLTREIGACDTRIRRMSHAFTVELVAGLYRKLIMTTVVEIRVRNWINTFIQKSSRLL